METAKKVLSFDEFMEAAAVALRSRILLVQFLGVFLALAVFFTALSIAALSNYAVVGACVVSFGLLLAYPLFALTIEVSCILHLAGIPEDWRAFAAEARTKAIWVATEGFICALVCLLLAVPQSILLKISAAGEAGQILAALFVLPIFLISLVQVGLLYAGAFVLPQLIATESGDPVEIFQNFKELLLVAGKRLVLRHAVGIVLAILFALPAWAYVEVSAGVMGVMTAAIASAPLNPGGGTQEAVNSPALEFLTHRAAGFAATWLQFSHFARYLAGVAAVFILAIPLTLGIAFQNANGLLAIRRMISEAGFTEFSPPE